MKIKIYSVILALFIVTLPSAVFAQVELTRFAGRGKVGTTGFQFLKIGVGARAVSMSESFIAMANDATAMYYNPAGMTQMVDNEVVVSLIKWPADIQYGFVGAAIPTALYGTIGVFVGTLTTGDMKRTVPYKDWNGEYFSATDWVAGVSYSRALTDKFSIGGNIKYIGEFLDTESVQSWAVDFGTLFDIGVRKMKFAMMITNFGPNLKFLNEEFSLPITFKIGAIVEAFNWNNNILMVTAEGSHPNDNLEQFAMGLEYSFMNKLFLRGGYRAFMKLEDKDKTVQLGRDKFIDVEEPLEGFSFGGGINIPIGGAHAKLDYAYSDLGYLQNAQRLTVTFNF